MPMIHNGNPPDSRVEIARLYQLARANSTQYLRRTNLRPIFQPILAYLQTVSDAGFNVPSRPRGRRAISASNATVSKTSKSTPTGAMIAGILVASLAVPLLLLLFCCYLKRRRRKAPSTHAPEVENGFLRRASDGLGSHGHGTVTASFPDNLPPRIPNHHPSNSQASSLTAVSVSFPTSPSSKVADEKDEKVHLPAPPPPLVLRPERSDSLSKGQQPDSLRLEKSKSIKSMKGRGRESVLPNPWDSDAKPSRAAFQSMVFKLPPSSTASIRPPLPQTPRARRTSLSPEVRPIEIS